MATMSVNTNYGAMIALQNLNATGSDLTETQKRISTGRKVDSAKDNGAIYAIAQNQRASSMSLNAVQESLQRGQSTVDVASAAASGVSDLLMQMKEKALAASDTSLGASARSAMNADFTALRDQITKSVTNAGFNGVNLIDGTTTSLQALANDSGSQRLTILGQNLNLGQSIITVATTDTIGTATTASSMIATVSTSIENLSLALAKMGTAAKAYDMHLTFVGKLRDAIDSGVSNIVDADLARESARIQALQTKQQLGYQALAIANQTPQSLLSLFR